MTLFVSAALAQTQTNTTTTTTVAPVQTQVPEPQPDQVQQKLQSLLKGKNSQQALGQAMVAGIMLGCVKKQVGVEATNAFYQDLQMTGKAAEAYCKAQQPAQARALIISKVEQKRNDPVTIAAISCYDQQSAAIAGMGGPKLASDMAHYVTWLRTPGAAEREIKENDICKEKKV